MLVINTKSFCKGNVNTAGKAIDDVNGQPLKYMYFAKFLRHLCEYLNMIQNTITITTIFNKIFPKKKHHFQASKPN